jgi:RNA polymerase sigma factor (sigma-70 family)
MDDKRGRFEAQVMPHLDAAHRFARWLSRSSDDADDVVQEAFLRAFRGFDGLRGSDVKAWLLTIVRNCHATALKQQQRRAAVPLPEEHDEQFGSAIVAATPDPESASTAEDDKRTLDRLIAALPQEHREVLLLRELEDMSYREIAAVTRLPIGTVMSRLARARAALRVKWLQETPGEPRAVR